MEVRRPKTFYARVNPLERYSEEKFIARYRLPKDLVRSLAHDYANSDHCSTTGERRGGGLSGEERVCINKCFHIGINNFL